MDIDLIKKLLEKYYEGDTTLEEEAVLRDYFNNEEVAQELQKYQSQFVFYQQEREIKYQNYDYELPKVSEIYHTRRRSYWITAAAAAILLIISIIFFLPKDPFSHKQSNVITVTDPDSTYRITKYALYAVSENLNKGLGKLDKLEYLQDGMNALNKLNLSKKESN
ncbi:MAG TPA: hypothetical protein PLC04_07640 [Candidatus Kapabacteria bacterium]|nr:hypothetical protein [Candidatus Kapabacteria bacterium]